MMTYRRPTPQLLGFKKSKHNLIESSAFNKLIEAYIVQLGTVNIVIIISSILIIIIIIIMKSLE